MLDYMRIFISLLITAFLIQCVPEPPHSNPLDPYRSRPEANTTGINGLVVRKNIPHFPVENCRVTLLPLNQFTLTDSSGRFSFSDLVSGQYKMVAEKNGFLSDTLVFHTDSLNSSALLTFYLNSFPQLIRFSLYSKFIDQWWPDPFFLVEATLVANDPDGVADMQIPQLLVPELNQTYNFLQTARGDSFVLQIKESDLPDNNIFTLVGQRVVVRLEDQSGAVHFSEPYYLHRIIDTAPEPISPKGLDIVSPRPVFIWEAYVANFNFTYEISTFFVNAGIALLIHQSGELPASQLQYQYPDSLPSGDYFWTVGVRDALGNSSRSREAAFRVP
ncbi:MAG: hypothetical protein Kow0042_02330 [Calditrichia bacterium]